MKRSNLLIVAGCVMSMAVCAWAAPAPLVELAFANDDLTNTGSVPVNGWMTDGSTPTYVPGVAATLGNDPTARAFDNTFVNPAATNGLIVGNNTAGTPGPLEAALNGAQSFTVMAWFYKPSAFPALGLNANAWYRRENSAYYHYNIRSFTDTYARPRSHVNNTMDGYQGVYQYWNYTDQWMFTALTYDAATDDLISYRASQGMSSVIPVARVLSVGPLNSSDYGIMFGDRDWYCYMDNCRVYASLTDASGALGEADLNDLFTMDKMMEVPEPVSMTLLSVGAVMFLRRRK